MNSQEMKENFLISMGCKLSGKYKYIQDIDFDYQKEAEEKEITVCNHKIPITTKLINTKNLFWDLQYASLQYSLDIRQQMLSAVESGYNNDKIAAFADYAINNGKVYVTDFLKYVSDRFKIDEKLMQYLISLSTTAITTLNNDIVKTMDKYQIKLSNAHMDALNYQNQLNQQTAAEAAAAPKTTTMTTTYYEGLTSWSDYSYTYATTRSSMGQAEINACFAANASLSSMLESSGVADAGSTTIKELGNIIDGVILKFNESLAEILVYKIENLFDKNAFNHVKDVEKNPLDFENWSDILTNIQKEEYQNLVELSKRYGFTTDIADYLSNYLCNEEYNYYIENKKCDYSNDKIELFELVNGNVDELNQNLSNNIYNYYKKEIANKAELSQLLKVEISACNYLLDNSKTNLISTITTNDKNYVKGIISSLFKFMLSTLLLFPVYKVHAWIQYMYVNDIDEFRTSIQTTGDKVIAIILYIPIAALSLLAIGVVISYFVGFIKSLKK